MLLRALDVGSDGVREVLELAGVGCHGDLGAFHAVVEARVGPAGEVGWEPVVVEVVDELAELREHELADGSHREAHVVHGDADGRPLEVPAVERHVARDVDDGVVVHGVDLALDRVGGGADGFDVGAQPLRGRAERVPVLFRLLQRIGRVQLRGRLHV